MHKHLMPKSIFGNRQAGHIILFVAFIPGNYFLNLLGNLIAQALFFYWNIYTQGFAVFRNNRPVKHRIGHHSVPYMQGLFFCFRRPRHKPLKPDSPNTCLLNIVFYNRRNQFVRYNPFYFLNTFSNIVNLG